MAAEVGVSAQAFEEGLKLAQGFINPLLDGSAGGLWMPGERPSDTNDLALPPPGMPAASCEHHP
jgi:hypothetical protein